MGEKGVSITIVLDEFSYKDLIESLISICDLLGMIEMIHDFMSLSRQQNLAQGEVGLPRY